MNHGLIHEKLDIKILILFILQRLPETVNAETLMELTFCDSGVGYFDYIEALSELIDTEHIAENEFGYKITEKGRRNGSIIETSIPYSVRNKAERVLTPIATAMRRDAMIKTSHEYTDSGCMVDLTMSDNKGEIISLRMITAGEDQARQIENSFRKNAENMYSKIAEMLLND